MGAHTSTLGAFLDGLATLASHEHCLLEANAVGDARRDVLAEARQVGLFHLSATRLGRINLGALHLHEFLAVGDELCDVCAANLWPRRRHTQESNGDGQQGQENQLQAAAFCHIFLL